MELDFVTIWEEKPSYYGRGVKYTFFLNYHKPIVMVNQHEQHYKWLADGGIVIFDPQMDFDKKVKSVFFDSSHEVVRKLTEHITNKMLLGAP